MVAKIPGVCRVTVGTNQTHVLAALTKTINSTVVVKQLVPKILFV